MELVPIKLLKNGVIKRRLLSLKGENPNIDTNDFLEGRINVNTHAKHLLAIEDASEMAKQYLQREGLFEKIAADIKAETGKDFTFKCRKTLSPNKNGREFVLLEHTFEDGAGHYGMVAVNHLNKTLKLYDSMGETQKTFHNAVKAIGYERQNKSVLGPRSARPKDSTRVPYDPQPTGGFVAASHRDRIFKRFKGDMKRRAWELSQYDEMSQHHFCYVESFIAMMKELGLTDGGPADPRIRLNFIKRVVWGLIHKYIPKSERNTIQWRYFETNFKYVLTTRTQDGRLLPMVDGVVQKPPQYGQVKKEIKKLRLRGDIDRTWSITKIVNWAGSKNLNNK